MSVKSPTFVSVNTPTPSYLCPPGYAPPRASALRRELRVGPEFGRYVAHQLGQRVGRGGDGTMITQPEGGEPVLMVPGFMAGDYTLALLGKRLRTAGYRTYRAQIPANISCVMANATRLERRLETIADRRGSRVRIVGHSLGGLIGRGLAVRRPDLVSSTISLGSPIAAPGAHHPLLAASLLVLMQLSKAGVPGVMSRECVTGVCAQQSFAELRTPVPDDVEFTAFWSLRDGIVDPHSCYEADSEALEVRASHCGMVIDPVVLEHIVSTLGRHRAAAGAQSALTALPAG
jgi:triacylglycerol lipase